YEEFIHKLQDRELKAANRRRKLGFRDVVEIGHFGNTFVVRLILTGSPDARADISRVDLRCDDVAQETVRIGDPQDSDQTHFAYIPMTTGSWAEPQTEDGSPLRGLGVKAGDGVRAHGELTIRAFELKHGKKYSFRIRYRALGEGRLVVHASRNSQAI